MVKKRENPFYAIGGTGEEVEEPGRGGDAG